jgi:hypothetical protein
MTWNPKTRVSLTELGWLYQIGRVLARANSSTDPEKSKLLREEAKKMIAVSGIKYDSGWRGAVSPQGGS